MYSPALTDFILMVDQTSNMFITGPDVIKTVTGEDVTQEDLGGARTHNTKSGVAQFMATDEADCFELTKGLLGYLPSNNMEQAPAYDEIDLETLEPDVELDTFIPDGVNPLPPSVTDQNGSPIPQSGYMNVCPGTSTSVTWNYANHPEITGTDPIDGSTIPPGRHVYRVTITLANPNGGGTPTGGPSITNATGRAFWNTGS